jgi:hypothetical protein
MHRIVFGVFTGKTQVKSQCTTRYQTDTRTENIKLVRCFGSGMGRITGGTTKNLI